MLKLKKVAITGGLACGKSSVCRIFQDLGAYVVSADQIVHQLLSPNTDIGQNVIRLLGQDIVVNDQIDRSIIARKVFNHPELLKSLEKLLHPAVQREVDRQYEEVKKGKKGALFVAEIPLLFEGESYKRFEASISVMADPEVCKKRFMQATGYGEEEYEKRAANQLSPLEKAKRATYVIYNNGSFEELRKAVTEIYENLIH